MTEHRDQQIHFRVSKVELERIRQKMESCGILSIGSYLRKMALDGYCLNLDLPQLRRMAYLLQNCSNNLNQYAKRANETGSIYTEDIKDLQNRQNEIREITKEILSAMVVGLLYLVLVVCIVMLLFQHVWIYAIPLFWISFCICFIVLVNFTAFAMVING